MAGSSASYGTTARSERGGKLRIEEREPWQKWREKTPSSGACLRTWAGSAWLSYPSMRLPPAASFAAPGHPLCVNILRLRQPHFLAFFLLGHKDDDFVTWLFLSRSGLFMRGAEMSPNIFTSRMKIITTGTPMLLVRATFCLASSGNGAHGGAQDGLGEGSLSCMPGSLQGFDLWHMRWLTPSETLWSPMRVDRHRFAAAHVGKHVYFAGGDGFIAAKSAERLSLETWAWEIMPPMHLKGGSIHRALQ
ncbi:hypothetical protein L7F22_013984 [Adiantum nelumboides]|nr:hypothetical protein [Adiantum nelumboides]